MISIDCPYNDQTNVNINLVTYGGYTYMDRDLNTKEKHDPDS